MRYQHLTLQVNPGWFEAEAYRLNGNLLLQSGSDQAALNQAEACFQTARQVAIQQGAKTLAARVEASLDRLQKQGKTPDR